MAIGSSDSCDLCLRNESYLSECPLIPEGGCNVTINVCRHVTAAGQIGLCSVSWLFCVTVLHIADRKQF
jgi:hypothetical protein